MGMIEPISAAALEYTEEFSEGNVLIMAIVFGVLAAFERRRSYDGRESNSKFVIKRGVEPSLRQI